MASTLETVLKRIGVNLGVAAVWRQVEEVLQPVLERAITTGMDENATLRAMALATRDIPGLRVAAHAAVSASGAVLGEYADAFWPGDDRALTRTMRATLKRLGPQLHFASDIGADALERAVKEKADGIVSPATTASADRNAELDQGVFLWPSEPRFRNRILVPVHNPDGSIRFYDFSRDLPFIRDSEVMEEMTKPEYNQSTTRTVRAGKGQPSRQVTDPPRRPNIIGPFAIRDAAQMVDMGRWDPAAAEAIQRLLAPKPPPFAMLSAQTKAVLLAYNAGIAARSQQTGFDWLDKEETEGVVESAKKTLTTERVSEWDTFVGEAFYDRIRTGVSASGVPIQILALADCAEVEQVFDHWLGGEQTKSVKAMRVARRLQRHGAMRGVSPLSVMWAVAGITSPIWMPIIGFVLCLLVAVLLFVQGVFTPITGGTVPFLGTAYDSKAVAMGSVFLSGWLAFAVTWAFPAYEAATAWLGLKPDSLKSLGRRIVAFGLLFCSGIEFYAVALNATPIWRMVILAAAGVGIAVAMGLTEAGDRYMAEEMVRKAARPTILVFAIIPILLTFTVGVAQSNPVQTLKVGTWFAALTAWHWIGFGALVVFALLLVSILFGKSKAVTGESDRAMTFASVLLVTGAIIAVLVLGGWLLLASLHEIGSWFGGSASATTTTTVVTQPEDNGPWFDSSEMCADPITVHDQQQILKCP